ncbi:hypothetical protein Tco_0538164 [Tanacetum coccineum]
MENGNPFVPAPPNGFRARITQELDELHEILPMIDSCLENIGRAHIPVPPHVPFEQFLDDFMNPPNELVMDDLESNTESYDTPLVSPFLGSDEESDDGEVINELNEYGNAGNFHSNRIINSIDGNELAFSCIIEGLESMGRNLVAIVRDVYVFVRSFTYVTDFVVVEYIREFSVSDFADVVMGRPFGAVSQCIEYQVDEDMKEWLIRGYVSIDGGVTRAVKGGKGGGDKRGSGTNDHNAAKESLLGDFPTLNSTLKKTNFLNTSCSMNAEKVAEYGTNDVNRLNSSQQFTYEKVVFPDRVKNKEVNERFANYLYGYFIGKRIALMRLAGDDVAGIKRYRRDQSSDGVRNMTTASGRGRLKEDLESSTWRRSIERFLNNFANQPNETNMNDLESDDESVDTPLVSPFPHSDNDSDDGEVLNKLIEYKNVRMLRREKAINSFDGDDLEFQCMIGFRKSVAYFDPFLPMNIITLKAYNTIMVEGLESIGKNLVSVVRDVYMFVGSFTYITDFVVLEDIGEFIQINKAEVVIFDEKKLGSS